MSFSLWKRKIEFNPSIISGLNDENLELYLKAEVIRILLKHPYERQPDSCRRTSMSLGSNLVLADNYDFEKIGLPKPETYNLPKEESYEWYSFQIEQQEKAKEGGKDQQKQGVDNDGKNENVKISSKKGENNDRDSDMSDNNNPKGAKSEESKGDRLINGAEETDTSDIDEIQLPDGTIMKLPKSNGSDKSPNNSNDEREEEKENSQISLKVKIYRSCGKKMCSAPAK